MATKKGSPPQSPTSPTPPGPLDAPGQSVSDLSADASLLSGLKTAVLLASGPSASRVDVGASAKPFRASSPSAASVASSFTSGDGGDRDRDRDRSVAGGGQDTPTTASARSTGKLSINTSLFGSTFSGLSDMMSPIQSRRAQTSAGKRRTRKGKQARRVTQSRQSSRSRASRTSKASSRTQSSSHSNQSPKPRQRPFTIDMSKPECECCKGRHKASSPTVYTPLSSTVKPKLDLEETRKTALSLSFKSTTRKLPVCSRLMRTMSLSEDMERSHLLPDVKDTRSPTKTLPEWSFRSTANRSPMANHSVTQLRAVDESTAPIRPSKFSSTNEWEPAFGQSTAVGGHTSGAASLSTGKRTQITGYSPFGLQRPDLDQGPKLAGATSSFLSQRESGFKSPPSGPKGFGKTSRDDWRVEKVYFPGASTYHDPRAPTEVQAPMHTIGTDTRVSEWKAPATTTLKTTSEKLPWPKPQAPGFKYDVYKPTVGVKGSKSAIIDKTKRDRKPARVWPSPGPGQHNPYKKMGSTGRAAGFGYGRRSQWIDPKKDEALLFE